MFKGETTVRGEKIFIDSSTGKGYGRLLRSIGGMLEALAQEYNIPGYTVEDNRQEIKKFALEAVCKYDDNRNTSLSTFIFLDVKNKLINSLRNNGRQKRNPTVLNTTLCRVKCMCGNSNVIAINNGDDIKDFNCDACSRPLEAHNSFVVNTAPLKLNDFVFYKNSSSGSWHFADIDNDDMGKNHYYDMIYDRTYSTESITDFKLLVDKVQNSFDHQVLMLRLNDMNIKEIYKKLKCNYNAVRKSLDNLQTNSNIKSFVKEGEHGT